MPGGTAQRTLVHVDNSLRDQVGHYFHFAASLQEEARRQDVAFRVLAHADVTPEVRRVVPAEPVFRHEFHGARFDSRLLRNLDPQGRRYDFLRSNLEFYRDLRRGLKGTDRRSTVFMPMASHRELLAWDWWMRSRPAWLAPELVLMFRLNYTDVEDPGMWDSVSDVAGAGFRVLRRLAAIRPVRVATDSERLADEYRGLMGVPVEVFPIPHTESGAGSVRSEKRTPAPTRFVMLGDLREDKGFPTLVEALRKLHERGDMAGMEFTLQTHIGSRWHDYMEGYRRALQGLGLPNVRLLTEALDSDAYYRLIDEADVVVVPYGRRTYYARTSGPLTEAFAAGKPVIATEDTWMSDQVAFFEAGLTFRDGDPDDLARALVEARMSNRRLQERAEANRTPWLRFHNPSAFLDSLLNGPGEEPAEPDRMPRPVNRVLSAAERLLVSGTLLLARRRAAESDAEAVYQRDQERWLRYHRHRVRFADRAAEARPRIDFDQVRNALSNSGAVPLKREFESVSELVGEFSDPARRSEGFEGHEGFAPDDAVFDEETESGEVWSYADLAAVIADFAYESHSAPSVLDLGCGPAHLFFFLSRYGVVDYMGIDGNPLLLEFVRHVRGSESRFRILDLQDEIALEQDGTPLRFDVLCSFEVLEHIREDKLDRFLKTVRNHMHAGSTFLCTASTLDTMDVHVLVRDREWWLRRFAEAGLVPRPGSERLAGRLLENHPFNWTAASTNVFVLTQATAADPARARPT